MIIQHFYSYNEFKKNKATEESKIEIVLRSNRAL